MPRPGLSAEEIIAAANSLLSAGEKVTIQGVREKLGNRGSITTISKVLKEWKEGLLSKESGTSSLTQESSMQQKLDIEEPEGNKKEEKEPGTSFEESTSAPPEGASSGLPTAETPASAAPAAPQQERRFDRRERLGLRRRHDHHQRRPEGEESRQAPTPQQEQSAPTNYTPDIYHAENLDTLSDKELAVKIRRLEIYLNKEQSRREAAEKMAREAKEYAEVIKEQIGQRIADLRQAMEQTINELKAEARDIKDNAEADLRFYREQLEKANKKIMSLLSPDNP